MVEGAVIGGEPTHVLQQWIGSRRLVRGLYFVARTIFRCLRAPGPQYYVSLLNLNNTCVVLDKIFWR